MNKDLYPLKFTPIYKDRIWAGDRLYGILEKDAPVAMKAGESWELSGVEGDVSVVSEGYLAGNDLQELIETYMGDIVGDEIYDKFGINFPLLIKFIDAAEALSVQVHPDDKLAGERHNSFGKTEMWYVVEAEPEAELISGFNTPVNADKYRKYVEAGKLTDILHSENVAKGDVFFIPAGRVHAIGAGTLIAEIQQTSDITYRIFDWNRLDDKGKPRELHTDLAVDAIDYSVVENAKTVYSSVKNESSPIVDCPYFTTRIIDCDRPVICDFSNIDSFVIYICTDGLMRIDAENSDPIIMFKGETVLMPAAIKRWKIVPSPVATCLEIFINNSVNDGNKES